MPRMFRPILTTVETAVQKALKEAGQEMLKRSNELVPVKTGNLKKSGRVRVDDLTASIKYTAPHAHLVHERTDWNHPTGGQAKFLATAADESDLPAKIIDAVKAAMDG